MPASPIVLATPTLRCVIDPSLGAGIADFSTLGPLKTWYPIMRRAAPGETNASLLGSFIMAPWANRISGDPPTVEYAGRSHALVPTSPAGTPSEQVVAQHGDVRKRPWRVEHAAANASTLTFDSREHTRVNWPWTFACVARFALAAGATPDELGRLTIDLDITNTDADPFPVGCGHHPYFMRRLWADDDAMRLRVPVTGRYPLTHGCATGPAEPDAITRLLASGGPIPEEHIDGCFVGQPGAPAELLWPASGVALSIEPSANLAHWVVYVPRESGGEAKSRALPFIAVEPQSHANDAINLARRGVGSLGLSVLDPGTTFRASCSFSLRRLSQTSIGVSAGHVPGR